MSENQEVLNKNENKDVAENKVTPVTSTVKAGVPTGVTPTEAQFAPGDKVQVEKDGVWANATINAVSLTGIADADGNVKYTVTRDAVNGVANYTPEQYVAQRRVRAVEAPVEAEEAKTNKPAKAKKTKVVSTAPELQEDEKPKESDVAEDSVEAPVVSEAPAENSEVTEEKTDTPSETLTESETK